LKAHKGAINALTHHIGILLSGSNDQTIKLFKISSLDLITTIDCNKLLTNSVNCSIRALDAY